MKPFTHDAKIPVTFALSVYAILHNKAAFNDWERVAKEPNAMEWIKSIYASNDFPWTDLEENWWTAQLKDGEGL